MKKCPKCGFNIINNYCVRCGYYKGKSISDSDIYQNKTNELEILLKDDYQKIIYNKNLLLIFLLGPLYFGYYNCYLLSMLFIFIEFIITCLFGMLANGSLFVIIFILLISRIIYVLFANTLLKKSLLNKINKIKTKDNYKEILFYTKPHSIFNLVLSVLFYLLIIIIWIIIYRTYRGNW